MIDHVFVYGTLRPGQQRWRFLQPFVTDDGHDDSVSGALYDTGHGYPAARFGGDSNIRGRVYSLQVDRLTQALELLDEVEGAVLNLFERVAVATQTGCNAWAYQIVGDTNMRVIASGDWLSR